MQYAGLGSRAVAIILDVLVLFAILWIVALATGNTNDGGFQMDGAPVFVGFGLFALYFLGLEATSGATLGKMLVGIKVVKADGSSPIGLTASLLRNVLRIVDGQLFYLVAFLFVRNSDMKQRLGDRVAGTIVIKRASASR